MKETIACPSAQGSVLRGVSSQELGDGIVELVLAQRFQQFGDGAWIIEGDVFSSARSEPGRGAIFPDPAERSDQVCDTARTFDRDAFGPGCQRGYSTLRADPVQDTNQGRNRPRIADRHILSNPGGKHWDHLIPVGLLQHTDHIGDVS
jgi:hypothetical protein